jgi:hypothetical protein
LIYIFLIDFVTNKIEEKTGMDLNKDGRVGGSGMAGQATHMGSNCPGPMGGNQAPGGGGK